MDTCMVKEIIHKTKIIAIIRGIPKELLGQTIEALVRGGIKAVEITLNRSDAIEGIREITEKFGDSIAIGAGTVMTVEQVDAVASAGGKYIISPNVDLNVIKRTKALKLLSIPGAMTPTEIVTARAAGADYVKLFPAASLGIGYFKAIRSPLPDIPFIVVGGIGSDNIKDFLDAGAQGAGIGGKLADRQLVSEGRFDEIAAAAAHLISKINSNG